MCSHRLVSRLPVMILVSGLFVAASTAPPTAFDDNLRRLGSMPHARRLTLAGNLERFDRLPADQQSAIVALDDRIQALEPEARAGYIETLRRYHLWVSSLDPKTRERIDQAADPTKKLAVITEIREKGAKSKSSTVGNLGLPLGDLGTLPPIELGNWIRVWLLALNDAERKRIESFPAIPRRIYELNRAGEQKKITPHYLPMDEEQALLKRLEENPLYKSLVAAIKARQEKMQANGLVKKQFDSRPQALARPLHHLTESLYFLDHPPKPVSAANLARFEAALPAWMRDSLDPLAPNDARRRLTILYREVFPHPGEMPKSIPSNTAKKAMGPVAPPSVAPATNF